MSRLVIREGSMGLQRFGRRGAFTALTTVVLGALAIAPPSAGPAAAAAAPYVQAAHGLLLRGMNTDVFGGGLQADTSYDLVAQYGRIAGSPSAVVTTSDTGAFSAVFDMTTDVPFDVNSVGIAVIDPADDSTVATTTVTVGPPEFLGGGCAGRPLGDWNVLDGPPLPPTGADAFSSDHVTFTHPSIDVHGNGDYFAVYGTAAKDLPVTFTVTATRQGPQTMSWSWTWQRNAAFVSRDQRTPWSLRVRGGCFAPGETVDVATHDRRTSVPHSVRADAAGHVAVTTVIRPAAHPISASR